jgi:hypothetical protein
MDSADLDRVRRTRRTQTQSTGDSDGRRPRASDSESVKSRSIMMALSGAPPGMPLLPEYVPSSNLRCMFFFVPSRRRAATACPSFLHWYAKDLAESRVGVGPTKAISESISNVNLSFCTQYFHLASSLPVGTLAAGRRAPPGGPRRAAREEGHPSRFAGESRSLHGPDLQVLSVASSESIMIHDSEFRVRHGVAVTDMACQ